MGRQKNVRRLNIVELLGLHFRAVTMLSAPCEDENEDDDEVDRWHSDYAVELGPELPGAGHQTRDDDPSTRRNSVDEKTRKKKKESVAGGLN